MERRAYAPPAMLNAMSDGRDLGAVILMPILIAIVIIWVLGQDWGETS